MIPRVNYHWLSFLLWPLNTLDAFAEAEVAGVDPNAADEVKSMLRKHVVPHLAELSESQMAAAQLSLRYYLATGKAPFAKLLDEQQESPLRSPDDPRTLFAWLWEVLVPDERPALPESYECEEHNDSAEVFSRTSTLTHPQR